MSTSATHYTQPETYTSPPITIILTVVLLVFFFVGFFSIYFCRCFLENIMHAWHLHRTPSGNLVRTTSSPINHGLDPKIIQSFPSFTYSSVKDFRCEKYALECAICLSEFADDDTLRLLTDCYHVFHQECIDLWLDSHKTCPVCRGELDLPQNTLEKSPVLIRSNPMPDHVSDGSLEDAISIVIREDVDNDEVKGEEAAAPNTMKHDEIRNKEPERFSRSHSTGHSIVRIQEEENTYTLRLPEHVKIKITRGHNATESCIVFGDLSSSATAKNGGFGEVSGCSGGDINKV